MFIAKNLTQHRFSFVSVNSGGKKFHTIITGLIADKQHSLNKKSIIPHGRFDGKIFFSTPHIQTRPKNLEKKVSAEYQP